jgi:thiamine biosynthesis lipoprotein
MLKKILSHQYFFVLVLLLPLIMLTSCRKSDGVVSRVAAPRNVFALGTVCALNLYEGGTDELYVQLATRLNEIECVFSVNLPDSEISRINQSAGISPVEVSKEVIDLLDKACYFARRTDGAFDPAIGPLVELWGIGTDHPYIPTQAEIDTLLPLVDWRDIRYDAEARTVFLPKKGMKLDFGAIAKGYAADELIAIIDRANVKRAIVDLGGNVYVWGKKTDGTKWRVGIKNPYDPEGEPVIRLDIDSNTVVTSGTYERFFEQDGVRYHHILDPKTGYPAYNGILSSTIVCESSLVADGLSTSVFVMGKEKTRALLDEGFQDAGFTADVIIIGENHEITTTRNIKNAATVLLPEFFQAEW